MWKEGLTFLYAVEIGAVAGVNLNGLTFVDKERHANFNASLHLCRLQCVGGGITLQTRFGIDDFELRLDGHLGIENRLRAGIADYFHNVAFLHEGHTRDEVALNGHLLVCFVVHEDVVSAFLIEVLVLATFHTYVLKGFADVEALFKHAAADNVLQRRAHDGVALSRFYVEEIDAEVELAIHADAGSFLDVL